MFNRRVLVITIKLGYLKVPSTANVVHFLYQYRYRGTILRNTVPTTAKMRPREEKARLQQQLTKQSTIQTIAI